MEKLPQFTVGALRDILMYSRDAWTLADDLATTIEKRGGITLSRYPLGIFGL